jgi:hypothetical protein
LATYFSYRLRLPEALIGSFGPLWVPGAGAVNTHK